MGIDEQRPSRKASLGGGRRRRPGRAPAIGDGDPETLRDHLKRAAARNRVRRALWGTCPVEQFVETLLGKSRGSWPYVRCVVREIEEGRRSPLRLDTLPEGIWAYYVEYWSQWRTADPSAWRDVHLPLLATVAAAQEALVFPRLCAFAQVEADPDHRRLLDSHLAPLIVADGDPAEPSYRLFDPTLREFFHGRVDRDDLPAAGRELVDELTNATQRAHGHIADHYLGAWGGLDAHLPRAQQVLATTADRYGLHHVATHLLDAGRGDQLHDLLQLEWAGPLAGAGSTSRRRNAWYTIHEAAGEIAWYVDDLARAQEQAAAARSGTPRPGPEEGTTRDRAADAVGRQLRYALMTASITSTAERVPPELITSMLEANRWTVHEALFHARQARDPAVRVRVLLVLARRLPASERAPALDEVMPYVSAEQLAEIIQLLPEPERATALEFGLETVARAPAVWGQSKLLPVLLPLLSTASRLAALDVVMDALTDGARRRRELEHGRLPVLQAVAPHLPESLLGRALELARHVEPPEQCGEVVAALAAHLPAPLVSEALAIARAIEPGEGWFDSARRGRAKALIALIPSVPAAERAAVEREALRAARRIKNRHHRAEALTDLALLESGQQRTGLLREALAAVRGIGRMTSDRGWFQEMALSHMAPHLSADLLDEALLTARGISDPHRRARALSLLLAYAPHPVRTTLTQEAKEVARQVGDPADRVHALVPLLAHLPEPEQIEVAAEALDAFKLLRDGRTMRWPGGSTPQPPMRYPTQLLDTIWDGARADAVAVLQLLESHLSEPLIPKAFGLVRSMKDEALRTEALMILAPRLPEMLLDELLRIVRHIGDTGDRVDTYCSLLAASAEVDQPLLAAALRELASLEGQPSWGTALRALAPHLPEAQVQSALEAALRLPDERTRLDILHTLIPCLSQSQLLTALDGTVRVQDATARLHVFEALAARLPPLGLSEPVIDAVQAVIDSFEGAPTGTGGHGPSPALVVALAACWQAIDESVLYDLLDCTVQPPLLARSLAPALLSAAPRLPDRLRRLAVAHAWIIEDGDITRPSHGAAEEDEIDAWVLQRIRADALPALLPHLPALRPAQAIDIVASIDDQAWRAHALVALVPTCPVEALGTVLEIARTVHDFNWRVHALTALLSRLREPERSRALEEAITAAWRRHSSDGHLDYETPEPLRGLLPKRSRTHRLLQLLPHLDVSGRHEVLTEALNGLGWPVRFDLPRHGGRDDELEAVAAHLSESLQQSVFQAAASLPREARRRAFRALVKGLPDHGRWDLLLKAFIPIPLLDVASGSADALLKVLPHLSEPSRAEVLGRAFRAAFAHPDRVLRSETLRRITPALLEYRGELWNCWNAACRTWARRSRTEVLTDLQALGPLIHPIGGAQAIREVGQAIEDTGHWWP